MAIPAKRRVDDDIWAEWFGFSTGGTATANTAALNAAIVEAAASGRHLRIGPGVFRVNDTILLLRCYNLTISGTGDPTPTGTGKSTILDWYGDDDRAAIELRDSKACLIENIQIRATAAERRLRLGVWLHWAYSLGVGTPVMFHNRFRRVHINGNDGHVAFGFEISKDEAAPDYNNSENTFEDCYVGSYSTWNGTHPTSCAWLVTQPQAKVNTLNRCGFAAYNGANGQGTAGYRGHASLTAINVSGGWNAEADYVLDTSNDTCTITGGHFENSKRFLTTGQNVYASVYGVSWDGNYIHDDGRVAILTGHTTLSGCIFYSRDSVNARVQIGSYGQTCTTISGCMFATSSDSVVTDVGAGQSKLSLTGCTKFVSGASVPFMALPDSVSRGALSTQSYSVGSQLVTPNGYARPQNPQRGSVFFDSHLGRPIWWSGSGWVYQDGTAAAAEWTPDLAGTLLGAWHFDSGVTSSSSLVSAVTAKYGTSAGLAQATGALQPTLLTAWRNGHNAIQGADSADFLGATLAGALTQDCTVYIVGEWTSSADGEIFGCSNGNILGRESSTFVGMHSGTTATASAFGAAHYPQPYWMRWHFDGAASDIVGQFGFGIGPNSTGLDCGSGDGNTAFRLGLGAGTGARHKIGMCLIYDGDPTTTVLHEWLREWGAIA